MNKLIKTLAAGAATVSLLAVTTVPVFAQEDRSLKPNSNNFQCDQFRLRVDAHIVRYNNIKSAHVHRKEVLTEKGNRIIEIAKQKGQDTSELEAALEEMQNKLEALDPLYDAMINKLDEISDKACDYDSEEEMKADINEAKTLIADLKAAWEEAKDYWHNTVKPLFQELVGQKPTRTSDRETE